MTSPILPKRYNPQISNPWVYASRLEKIRGKKYNRQVWLGDNDSVKRHFTGFCLPIHFGTGVHLRDWDYSNRVVRLGHSSGRVSFDRGKEGHDGSWSRCGRAKARSRGEEITVTRKSPSEGPGIHPVGNTVDYKGIESNRRRNVDRVTDGLGQRMW